MEEDFKYPGGSELQITLNFGWQMMFKEISGDGMLKEFEDMVDFFLMLLSPLIDEKNKTEEMLKFDEIGSGIDRRSQKDDYEKATRKRIRKKMVFGMSICHDYRMLLNRAPDYPADMDAYQRLFGAKGESD